MTQNPQDWQRPQQQWPSQPYRYPPQYQPPRRKGGAGKVIAFGCLGMVLIVVLVVVVAFLLASGHPNPATGA